MNKSSLRSKFKFDFVKLMVLISIIFVVAYLSRQNLFELPKIQDIRIFVLSFTILALAYIYQSWIWKEILSVRFKVGFKEAFISAGLAIFTKYIPGKVFSLVGRTTYLQKNKGWDFKTLNQLSLELQILAIITGFAVGGALIFYLPALYQWWYLFLLVFLGAIYYMFSNRPRKIAASLASKILKRQIEIPKIKNAIVVRLIAYLIVYWLIMGAGFYLFCTALTDIHPAVGFVMPLSVTVGVVSLIAPGGIGIREGVVALGLVFFGVDFKLAAGIAVAARLWFFVIETATFLAALFVRKITNSAIET